MTLTEDEKKKIIELYEKKISKKDISKTVKRSIPTIRKTIRENEGDEKIENEIKIGEILKDAFVLEGYDFGDKIFQLVFNLKRIAEKSGVTLYEFMEEIEYIMDEYYKLTDTPTEFYNYTLDFILKMSEIYSKNPNVIKVFENLVKKGIYLSNVIDEIKEDDVTLRELREEIIITSNNLEIIKKEYGSAITELTRHVLYKGENETITKLNQYLNVAREIINKKDEEILMLKEEKKDYLTKIASDAILIEMKGS